MFIFLKKVIAWIFKNSGIILGIAEIIPIAITEILGSIAKALVGIFDATPTKQDDKWIPRVEYWTKLIIKKIDIFFSAIKKVCYTISDFVAGKK